MPAPTQYLSRKTGLFADNCFERRPFFRGRGHPRSHSAGRHEVSNESMADGGRRPCAVGPGRLPHRSGHPDSRTGASLPRGMRFIVFAQPSRTCRRRCAPAEQRGAPKRLGGPAVSADFTGPLQVASPRRAPCEATETGTAGKSASRCPRSRAVAVPEMLKRPAGTARRNPRASLRLPAAGPDAQAERTGRPGVGSGGQSSLPPGETASRVRLASLSVPDQSVRQQPAGGLDRIDGELSGRLAAPGAVRATTGYWWSSHWRPSWPPWWPPRPICRRRRVYDPAVRNEERVAVLVGRWDFTAAGARWLPAAPARTAQVHLTMAWPKGPPKHHKLHVFVRYIAADGRKLQADGPIDIGRAKPPTRWASTAASTTPLAGGRTTRSPSSADGAARPQWAPKVAGKTVRNYERSDEKLA